EFDGPDFDVADLHAPGLRLSVQNALHIGAELLALGEHFVELVLAEHGAQGRLGQRQIVLDLDNCAFGIDDVEVEHRVDLHRNIVVGDHVLAGDFNNPSAQVVRRSTRTISWMGISRTRHGPLTLSKRPKVKTTARSYSRRMPTEAVRPTTIAKRTKKTKGLQRKT